MKFYAVCPSPPQSREVHVSPVYVVAGWQHYQRLFLLQFQFQYIPTFCGNTIYIQSDLPFKAGAYFCNSFLSVRLIVGL
jgi:hypothetical protein